VLQASENAEFSDTSFEEAIRALHFVLHMPAEYLDKNRRALIARAAIVCDVLLLKAGCSRIWDHILLRTLIFRVAQETGNVNVLVSPMQIYNEARTTHLRILHSIVGEQPGYRGFLVIFDCIQYRRNPGAIK
jgi:hypothetical protein